jgi:integration host factor subunit alpha
VNALSKAIMAETLCDDLGLNKNDAKDMVEHFFEDLRLCLESGHHAKLSGFGNFILRDKSQRPGRNPKTGKEIPVVARRVVTFKPGLKLKTKIENKK